MRIAGADDWKPPLEPVKPRNRRVRFHKLRYWSVSAWLILACCIIYVVDIITHGKLTDWGGFSINSAIRGMQVWRFVTCEFLHASPGHLFFNMLWLYFLGPLVEGWLGKRRYLAFYLICGAVAAGASAGMRMLHIFPGSEYTVLVGASGSIFGVMAAGATISPQFRISLILPPVEFTLKAVLWIMIGMAMLTIWTGGWNSGGEAAHIGGAAAGWLLIRRRRLLSTMSGRKTHRFWKPGDPRETFFRKDG